MLIGVLCEIVSAVAAIEKEALTVNFVKEKLQEIIQTSGLDEDNNGEISKEEFTQVLAYPDAVRAITEVGVDVFMLVDNIDYMFDDDDEEGPGKDLSFEDFFNMLIDLRGTNTASVKDIVELRKYIKHEITGLREDLGGQERKSSKNTAARLSTTSNPPDASRKSSIEKKTPAAQHTTLDADFIRQELRALIHGSVLPEIVELRALVQQMFSTRQNSTVTQERDGHTTASQAGGCKWDTLPESPLMLQPMARTPAPLPGLDQPPQASILLGQPGWEALPSQARPFSEAIPRGEVGNWRNRPLSGVISKWSLPKEYEPVHARHDSLGHGLLNESQNGGQGRVRERSLR
jgi:hypothetical protein